MSLLESSYEPFVLLNKLSVDDGYGGIVVTYTDGATIQGALVLDDSGTERIAQALGASQSYTLTVRKDINLDFHDVLRRVSDNKLIRITNDSDDKDTPPSAGLNMRQYRAEGFKL